MIRIIPGNLVYERKKLNVISAYVSKVGAKEALNKILGASRCDANIKNIVY